MFPYNQGGMDHASTSSNVILFFNLFSRKKKKKEKILKKKKSIREDYTVNSMCSSLKASCLWYGWTALPKGIAAKQQIHWRLGVRSSIPAVQVCHLHIVASGGEDPLIWRIVLTYQNHSSSIWPYAKDTESCSSYTQETELTLNLRQSEPGPKCIFGLAGAGHKGTWNTMAFGDQRQTRNKDIKGNGLK